MAERKVVKDYEWSKKALVQQIKENREVMESATTRRVPFRSYDAHTHDAPEKSILSKMEPLCQDERGNVFYDALTHTVGTPYYATYKQWIMDLRNPRCLVLLVALNDGDARDAFREGSLVLVDTKGAVESKITVEILHNSFLKVASATARRTGFLVVQPT
jgi:hypothetical protein